MVFTEKPAAMSVESVRKLATQAAELNCSVTVGYMKRHNGNINLLRSTMEEGKWGEISLHPQP